MPSLLLHCLLPLLLLVLGAESQSRTLERPCKSEEVEALWEFRAAFAVTSGSGLFDSWTLSTTCCSWKGVQCTTVSKDDDDSRRFTQLSYGYRVRGLTLPGMSLTGRIPPSIAAIRMLDTVDLSNNRISGSIPLELATLSRIRVLDLSRNNISGVLPDGFRDGLPGIVSLNLTDNAIEGDIPSMLSSLSLQSVDLSFNFFTGGIPDGFPCARVINVSNNLLTGPVLAPLARCNKSSVEILFAGGNLVNFSLTSEAQFFRTPAGAGLRVLDLNNNQLQGEIPTDIGLLANLEELSLHYNYLEGLIPPEILNCTRMRHLNLRGNRLRGEISTLNFSRLTGLTELELSYNKLVGDIPSSLSGCRSLTSLALAGNGFAGDIPPWLGALKSLNFLTLSGNELSGGFPDSLRECHSLVALVLSKNKFNTRLSTSGNFTGFRNLQLLAVGNSGLSGEIPGWISNCSKLQVLDLSWNSFTGEIPEWVGALDHLFYLDLSNNSLTGPVPERAVNNRCLQLDSEDDLRPVSNLLFVKHRSNASALLYHQVSAFPPSIILSNNHLSGEIPAAFGSLKKLVSLDLSNNWFTGSIPSGLANATDLEFLDLSSNRLKGSIPESLVRLTFLAFFNVSFNNLSGAIPSRNQFASFSNSSYMSNTALCGPPLVRPCASIQTISTSTEPPVVSSRSMNRGAIMGITISISLGLTALFATMVMLSFSRRGGTGTFPRTFRPGRFRHSSEENFKEMTVSQMMNLTVTMFSQHYRRMTVADLIKATDNFDPANIIGCGGFGLVFKAHLPDGNIVAIKRLTSDDGGPQMEREFDAELSTLGMITHENLVSLEGYCRLGRDRLLVYSYMENGSLDYWLHERPDGGSRLTWKNRLEILRETARGVEYLHRGCEPHIIHRDIKSSNILLDGEMRAHVADFGLARLILPSDTHVSTELVGTLGYIPPEYAESSVATLRGDVYSFGVLVLEVLSRRRPVDACRRGGVRGLVPWARGMQESGRGMEVMDPLMLQGEEEFVAAEGVVDEMLRVLDVACYCVDVCPQRRPGMKEVLDWLEDVGRRKRL